MRGNDSNPGIIPLTVDHLLASFEAQQDREFMIGMIYIEIYNEKIKNLLSSEERKLFVKEETETGNFEIQVRSFYRDPCQACAKMFRKSLLKVMLY